MGMNDSSSSGFETDSSGTPFAENRGSVSVPPVPEWHKVQGEDTKPTHIEIVPSDSSESGDEYHNIEMELYEEPETPKFSNVEELHQYNQQRLSQEPKKSAQPRQMEDFGSALDEENPSDDSKKNNKSNKVKKYIPFFTLVLTIVQVSLMAACVIDGGFEPWYQNPMLGPPAETLIKFGAKASDRMRSPRWQIWRFLTSWLLHGGIVHIVLNLLFQMTICLRLERYWGPLRIAPIYILSGIGGTLLSAIFVPTVITVGSSSCLAGLMGTLLTNVLMNWAIIDKPIRQLLSLSVQILMFVIIGILPVIDNFAHVGGLVVGFLPGLYLFLGLRPQTKPWLGL